MKAALITGTSGFVGSHLARTLRASYRIVEINRRPISNADQHIVWNFRDELPAKLPDSVDVLIHTAGTDPHDALQTDRDCFDVNVHATARLLFYAREAGAQQFVYFSTGTVYPMTDQLCRESDAIAPQGHSPSTRAAAEFLVRSYEPYMRTVCLRLFQAYGPGQRLPRLVPNLIDQIRNGRIVPLNGAEGRPKVNPVYIDDVIEWVLRLIEQNHSGTFNLAGPQTISIRGLAKRLGKLLDVPVTFENRAEIDGDLVAEIIKICEATGYQPKYNLDAGLARMLREELQSGTTT